MEQIRITDYGAKEGQICTQEIQKAFQAANEKGGLTVVIPAGTYLAGTLDIGGASIYLEKGAILKASPNPTDYRENGFTHNEMKKTISFLYSMHQEQIHIYGEGTLDLSGKDFYDFEKREVPELYDSEGHLQEFTPEQIAECTVTYTFRPTQPIFFYQCNSIRIEGITILDAPCWTLSFNDCENIHLEQLTIHTDPVIPNNDGMHFCGCRRVFIHGCDIISGDDCIALSGITDWEKPCEDFVISDCILCSSSKALVLGYMHSVIRNICISNCIIRDSHRGICIMCSTQTGLVEHVVIENVRIDTRVRAGNWWGNGEPICFFALYHNHTGYLFAPPKRNMEVNINDIQLRNISCSGENIIGIVGDHHNIRNITIDGLYYAKKISKNVCLKGENKLDLSPCADTIQTPELEKPIWLQLHQCKNVTLRNTVIESFQGMEPGIHMTECENVSGVE